MTDPPQPSEQDPPSGAELITLRKPLKGMESLRLREIWEYRELLQLLVWRNTVVRYKQSVVGIGWAVMRPLVSMVIYTLVFGKMAKLDTGDVPYPLFNLAGLLPWLYFANCLAGASQSLVGGSSMATKVYFPRLLLPLSTLFTGLIDFAIAFMLYLGLLAFYPQHVNLTCGIALLPVFMLFTMVTALAFGLWLSALMVRYRDIMHVLPFLTQCWMFATPVVYAAKEVPEKWRLIYAFNPMVGVVNGFRWALLGETMPDWNVILVSAAVTIVALVTGLYFFQHTEKTFADIV